MTWNKISNFKSGPVYEVVKVNKSTIVVKERLTFMTKLGKMLIKALKEFLNYERLLNSRRFTNEARKSTSVRVSVRRSRKPRKGKKS
jgi:hypothetical protein